MSKKKGDGPRRKDADEGDEYEFEMPDFDEQRFMRREVESARITFVTVAFAIVTGALAYTLDVFGGNIWFGWLAIFGGIGLLGTVLKKAGYSGELVESKALFGNAFLLFFTALAVWVLAYNVPF